MVQKGGYIYNIVRQNKKGKSKNLKNRANAKNKTKKHNRMNKGVAGSHLNKNNTRNSRKKTRGKSVLKRKIKKRGTKKK